MNKETIEYPSYVDAFKLHVGAVIHLIHWLVTYSADNAVDIAARAIAFSAPMPNALSVYGISQHRLGFGLVAAFAFAMTLELVIFATLEITMHMWDGYLKDNDRYHTPLRLAVAVDGVVLAVVIGLVYALEGSVMMALLPIISAASFVSLALKRWHDRGVNLGVKPKKKSVKKVAISAPALQVQPSEDIVKSPEVEAENLQVQPSEEVVNPKVQLVKDIAMRQQADGGTINISAISREAGVSRPTVTKYLNGMLAK